MVTVSRFIINPYSTGLNPAHVKSRLFLFLPLSGCLAQP